MAQVTASCFYVYIKEISMYEHFLISIFNATLR